MRAAVIESGFVVNMIEVESLDFMPGLVDGEGGGIGDLWNGQSFTKPALPALTVSDFERALDAHLDAKAQERRYTDRFTCALRAGYPGPFQAEGAAFAAWMDMCNAYAYSLLMQVQAGTRPPPASVAAFVEELPDLVWPT